MRHLGAAAMLKVFEKTQLLNDSATFRVALHVTTSNYHCPPIMESGLSKRMQTTLEDILPTIAAAAPPAQYNPTTAIDLSNAQNEVLRPELLDFFKTTVEKGVTSKV
jgi:hypothetical protein